MKNGTKTELNWDHVYEVMDEQFFSDCYQYGWLDILDQLSNLTRAISTFGKKGSRKGDFCPIHGGKKGDKYHLLPSAEDDGAGYCHKCKERVSGIKTIMLNNGVDFPRAVQMIRDLIYPNGKQPYPWQLNNGLKREDFFLGKPSVEYSLSSYTEVEGCTPKHEKPKAHHTLQNDELTDYEKKKAERLKAENNKLLAESFSINHEAAQPLRDYFISRAIDSWGEFGDSLRFHPAVKYVEAVESTEGLDPVEDAERLVERETKLQFLREHRFYQGENLSYDGTIYCDMGCHPCALFIMRDNQTFNATSLQRVYLSADGKKMELDGHHGITVKKRTTAIPGVTSTGSSCHIDSPVNKIIGVAEGPETTLAVRSAIGLPMNCCIDAGGLGNWVPNDMTDRVIIFTDKDASKAGRNAALKLQERLQSEYIEAMIVEPPLPLPEGKKSVDWQDAVQQLGLSAFPSWLVYWHDLD